MASLAASPWLSLVIGLGMVLVVCSSAKVSPAATSSFYTDFDVTWSPSKVQILNGGQELHLMLDSSSGSGFVSKKSYLHGNIDMQIKLVPGNSAGTVTAYYLSSTGENHDELDFEFLGNVSGQPYIVQTNVYANGVGGREQRIYLWFDPTADFHTYSLSWNKDHIIFLVDGTPIRVYANNENIGVPYPNNQPMQIFSSLWNGDDWATRGGLDKIDWAYAPFVASYRNFRANACVVSSGANPSNCLVHGADNNNAASKTIPKNYISHLRWVQRKFLIYDYCSDRARYPSIPAECTHNNL